MQRKISLKAFLKNSLHPQPGAMARTFNSGTLEVEAGRSLDSRPLWSTEYVPGQLGLHGETLSQKQNETKPNRN